ncbi:MAG: amino acid permease, partial [Vulcanococcus sp.]
AWTVVVAVPVLVLLLAQVRRRYRQVTAAISLQPEDDRRLVLPQRQEPLANTSLVWLASWTRPSLEALRYACSISDRVVGVWVCSERDDPRRIRELWHQSTADAPGLELQLLESPFASLIDPFVAYVEAEEGRHPHQQFTIVMPMAIPRYRFDGVLLNQRGMNLRRALDAHRNCVFTQGSFHLPG